MAVTLGNDFDLAVLTAAGINPDNAQLGTVQIDALPETGNVTVRYTAVATIDAEKIRELIREAAHATGEPTTEPDPHS